MVICWLKTYLHVCFRPIHILVYDVLNDCNFCLLGMDGTQTSFEGCLLPVRLKDSNQWSKFRFYFKYLKLKILFCIYMYLNYSTLFKAHSLPVIQSLLLKNNDVSFQEQQKFSVQKSDVDKHCIMYITLTVSWGQTDIILNSYVRFLFLMTDFPFYVYLLRVYRSFCLFVCIVYAACSMQF